jgi:hypothetical protein
VLVAGYLVLVAGCWLKYNKSNIKTKEKKINEEDKILNRETPRPT